MMSLVSKVQAGVYRASFGKLEKRLGDENSSRFSEPELMADKLDSLKTGDSFIARPFGKTADFFKLLQAADDRYEIGVDYFKHPDGYAGPYDAECVAMIEDGPRNAATFYRNKEKSQGGVYWYAKPFEMTRLTGEKLDSAFSEIGIVGDSSGILMLVKGGGEMVKSPEQSHCFHMHSHPVFNKDPWSSPFVFACPSQADLEAQRKRFESVEPRLKTPVAEPYAFSKERKSQDDVIVLRPAEESERTHPFCYVPKGDAERMIEDGLSPGMLGGRLKILIPKYVIKLRVAAEPRSVPTFFLPMLSRNYRFSVVDDGSGEERIEIRSQ